MKRKCNKIGNIPKYTCQEFYRTHPGQCQSVRDFCYSNSNNPLCKCINSPLNKYGAGEGMPPATCFDNQCANTGYKENSRYIGSSGVPCPTYINCKQVINASDGGVIENIPIAKSFANAVNQNVLNTN